MVAEKTQTSGLEPELAMHCSEVRRNHNWKYVADHLAGRREDMIRYMAHPSIISNHAVLAGLVGQVDELNYLFDVLGLDNPDEGLE